MFTTARCCFFCTTWNPASGSASAAAAGSEVEAAVEGGAVGAEGAEGATDADKGEITGAETEADESIGAGADAAAEGAAEEAATVFGGGPECDGALAAVVGTTTATGLLGEARGASAPVGGAG